MTIAILPSARDDLADGFDFYERQREGLGDYFLESIFSVIDSLRLYAGIHLKLFGFYRVLSKRFPYAAYYDGESNDSNLGGARLPAGTRVHPASARKPPQVNM